ncbi:MAG: disulfide bond formation protein B [Alphaproteobacteria bacterium]|nr:disulfide bond formation protein B [Alphaproteobacteria bacterium]
METNPRAPARLVPAAILAVGLAALGTALVAQFGFGLQPCHLCLIERVPYGVAAILAAVALAHRTARVRRTLVGLCAAAFAINAMIAFYHVGVEHHWWKAATCDTSTAQDSGAALTIEALNRAIEHPHEVPCDVVQWSLFGLSIAGYNGLASLALAFACAGAVLRSQWWGKT